jgi:hypothetical protein
MHTRMAPVRNKWGGRVGKGGGKKYMQKVHVFYVDVIMLVL